MSAFSVDTGRLMTPPVADGVVHNRLVQQTIIIIIMKFFNEKLTNAT